MFPSHQRFHGNSEDARGALGFDEMFTNAVVLDAPLMVCHNNHYDWREIGEKLHIARGQGMVVDISIFDAEKVPDNSIFNRGEHGLPTTGIPYVTVSGKIIVKDTLFQYDTFTGRLIRFPVEEKGRFEPLSTNQWFKEFSISAPDVHVPVGDEPDKESQKRCEKPGSREKRQVEALHPKEFRQQSPREPFAFSRQVMPAEADGHRTELVLTVNGSSANKWSR